MSSTRYDNTLSSAATRRLAGIVGLCLGACVMAGVITLFGDASNQPWIENTPDNLALVQQCDRSVDTQRYQACVQAAVKAVLTLRARTVVAQAAWQSSAATGK